MREHDNIYKTYFGLIKINQSELTKDIYRVIRRTQTLKVPKTFGRKYEIILNKKCTKQIIRIYEQIKVREGYWLEEEGSNIYLKNP